MKNYAMIFALLMLFILSVIIISEGRKEREQELKVIGHMGDHDVILVNQHSIKYIMSVENAYNEAYMIGTVIFLRQVK